MNLALNKTQVVYLLNSAGGDLLPGDVVVVGSINPSSFTTTTDSGYVDGMTGVIIEPQGILDGAVGAVAFAGYIPKINLSASATLGDVFKTHTVAGQAVPHATPMVSGDFGMVLGTGTSPAAILFPNPVQPQTSNAQYYAPTGLTGATSASRYVGATTTGAPTSGTFLKGDFVIDQSGLIWVCTAAGSPGTWDSPGGGSGRTLISELTPTGTGTASWTGISPAYKKLIIEFSIRSDAAAAGVESKIHFNSDSTSAHYLFQENRSNFYGEGHQSYVDNFLSVGAMIPDASYPTGYFAVGKVEIIQYANTNFNKIAQTFLSSRANSTVAQIAFNSTFWDDTSAINQVDILLSAGNYLAGSVLRLYGES